MFVRWAVWACFRGYGREEDCPLPFVIDGEAGKYGAVEDGCGVQGVRLGAGLLHCVLLYSGSPNCANYSPSSMTASFAHQKYEEGCQSRFN